MNRLVLSLLVENNPGVLSRVAGLFSRRGYGIDSLSVGKTNIPGVSRMTVVDIFRARIIDVAPASLVIEVTGDQSKIDGLLAMLEGFNVVEMVRTGLSGIKRGLSEIDIESHNK